MLCPISHNQFFINYFHTLIVPVSFIVNKFTLFYIHHILSKNMNKEYLLFMNEKEIRNSLNMKFWKKRKIGHII